MPVEVGSCGNPPAPLSKTVPNVLIIGDSISEPGSGYGPGALLCVMTMPPAPLSLPPSSFLPRILLLFDYLRFLRLASFERQAFKDDVSGQAVVMNHSRTHLPTTPTRIHTHARV